MGRSRKCNWKRKLKKAAKKGKPVMLTGWEYFNLNFLGQKKLPDSIMLKKRRGGYHIGFNTESDAKKAYETAIAFLKTRRPGHDGMRTIYDAMKKSLDIKITENNHKLRGIAPDYMEMFKTADGRYIDPELGNIDPEELKKLWEAALPKLNPSIQRIGVPIIFGTAGHDTVGNYFHEMWMKSEKFNIVAGADSADEKSEINYMDLSLGPQIQRAIDDQKMWKDLFFNNPLPKDFFEYDPNGRNK